MEEEEDDDDDDFEPSSFRIDDDEDDDVAEEEALAVKEEELQMELTQAEERMATLRATMNQSRVMMGRQVVEDPEEQEDDDDDDDDDVMVEEEEEEREEAEGGVRRSGVGIRGRGGGGARESMSSHPLTPRLEEEDEFEDYPEEDDEDEMYEFDFDKDDNVPGRERVLPASEKRAVLRKKLENDLGQIEFAAAHRILLDRYKRFERGEETPNDEEVVVQARMRKVRNFCVFFLASFF